MPKAFLDATVAASATIILLSTLASFAMLALLVAVE
jgi:hypothetical protein